MNQIVLRLLEIQFIELCILGNLEGYPGYLHPEFFFFLENVYMCAPVYICTNLYLLLHNIHGITVYFIFFSQLWNYFIVISMVTIKE